jgi:Peroxiredoxin
MLSKSTLLTQFCALLFLGLPVSAQAQQVQAEDERGYIVAVGQQVPDFTVHYLDGKKVDLAQYRGKVIMLQFTASWCSVCRQEMPFIESDIWQKHKSNPNFVLLGIDLKESRDVTAKFAEDMKISYPLTLDTDGSRFALFCHPKAGVTRNIIVDKTGKMVMLTRLYDKEEFAEMTALINKLLTE